MAYPQRNVDAPAEKSCQLYVKNFGNGLNDKSLHSLFSRYGKVRSASVRRSSQGQSLGFGFVTYSYPEEASAAIRHLNGFGINDQKLFVDYYQTRDERSIVLASHFLLEGSNLIIQNLEKRIDDLELKLLFSKFGVITSAKVMTKDHESLGYGFVCYSTVEAAQMAIKEMDGIIVYGKILTVKVHEKKASQKGTNLHVNNLDPRVTDRILQKHFQRFGKITSAKVMANSRGVSKNYGFVSFSTYDQAQAAIDGMDNQLIGDQFITVTFAQTKSDSGGQKSRNISESSDEMVQESKILIKNMASWMTEDTLKAIFSTFGKILTAQVLMKNGKSQCCGVVTFSSRKEAEQAIWGMDACPVENTFLEISILDENNEMGSESQGAAKMPDDFSSDEESVADDIETQQKKTNLYVKNLHPDVDEKELKQAFSKFGPIVNVKIARTEQGKSRQFGFVNFTTHKSASLAVEKKHDSMLRGMPLFVTFHQTKSERSAFMEQRLYQRLERVAGKDQDSSARPQRQRAVSQTRQNTRNCQDQEQEKNSSAMRSRSQAPRRCSRSQMNPDPLGMQYQNADAEEFSSPNCRLNRDEERLNRYLNKGSVNPISLSKHEDLDGMSSGVERKSRGHKDSVRMHHSVNRFFQPQDDHQPLRLGSPFDNPPVIRSQKQMADHKMAESTAREPSAKLKSRQKEPLVSDYHGIRMQQNRIPDRPESSSASDEEVMRTGFVQAMEFWKNYGI